MVIEDGSSTYAEASVDYGRRGKILHYNDKKGRK
jgi:hypothetical protein